MSLNILALSLISDFTKNYVLKEKRGLILLITFCCLAVAGFAIIRLVKEYQSGSPTFTDKLYKWGLGIVFLFVAPNIFSMMVLRAPVTSVILSDGQQSYSSFTEQDSATISNPDMSRWIDAKHVETWGYGGESATKAMPLSPELKDTQTQKFYTPEEIDNRYGQEFGELPPVNF
ncbi:hypothetical protein [Siphonobacter sp. SORGH_AS_1065]|uniref:hypothetical protein n=1 Tax=Siphonobacter sp. SORGH_AS_1065 TaxID=3041795 RepID=UPI00277DE994|nr:hypothetical protein [Siphonobacter sp. SORGH_AS_1065]MDQ1090461.1 hypothetical protein [Siphonobacter sp. SORGH_AS_1065]